VKAKLLDTETKKTILTAQKNELTEHFIYEKLSRSTKDPHNQNILKHISSDELKHYNFWKKYTQEDVKPDKLKIWKYLLISTIFGITFGIKLMERGEEQAQVTYEKISKFVPDAESVVKDEDEHEKQLINLIDEERLRYVGSMVLGLNDALVELTGALAGLTLALQNTRLIAMTGLITGIAASLSMATSEYLSTKSEEDNKNPFKASIYTGSIYVITVLFLIFPYLIFTNFYFCLGFTILNAIIVIFIFTFYISVAKDLSFRNRFVEMTLISLGIAALTFAIGFLIRIFLNVEV
jgi:VIT1/CCC1 family predicted Fe2+/Mn2+ transporter